MTLLDRREHAVDGPRESADLVAAIAAPDAGRMVAGGGDRRGGGVEPLEWTEGSPGHRPSAEPADHQRQPSAEAQDVSQRVQHLIERPRRARHDDGAAWRAIRGSKPAGTEVQRHAAQARLHDAPCGQVRRQRSILQVARPSDDRARRVADLHVRVGRRERIQRAGSQCTARPRLQCPCKASGPRPQVGADLRQGRRARDLDATMPNTPSTPTTSARNESVRRVRRSIGYPRKANPMPRIVWIRRARPPASSLCRRLATCTSSTVGSG